MARDTDLKMQSKRDRSKQARSRRADASGAFDVLAVDPVAILALVYAFAIEGGATRWGCTRDGGVLAVGCYMADDYATEYVRPKEDFLAACTEIAAVWLSDEGSEFHRQYNRIANPAAADETRQNGRKQG